MKNTKRNAVLATFLILSLAITVVVAVISPALASKNPDNSSGITVYGTSAGVDLSLPPPGGAVAGHPTNLKIEINDWNRRSETGAFDSIVIWIWSPGLNGYAPLAAVLDIPIPDWYKEMWNGTIVYQEANGVVIRNNIFSVADKELDVWMESVWTCYGYGHTGYSYSNSETLKANLTVPLQISNASLPPSFGIKNFAFPPTQIEIHEIGEGWSHETSATLPKPPFSGYTQTSKHTDVPALARVSISGWISEYETADHIKVQETRTYTPPAP